MFLQNHFILHKEDKCQDMGSLKFCEKKKKKGKCSKQKVWKKCEKTCGRCEGSGNGNGSEDSGNGSESKH